MSLQPHISLTVPEETARIARAAFPKGNNPYLKMRDELGVFYEDQSFAELFPTRGQPAETPWRLALITVMQFAEGLSDRDAADAVRSRIDWKYALGLELTDSGFDFSVLSKFRRRLVEGDAEQLLLEAMLKRFKTEGLLKAGGKQRTDSTSVLAAVCSYNRLEKLGETLRMVLNDLAVVAPEWLRSQVSIEWFKRYSLRFESNRVPKEEQARKDLAETIGWDGLHLLAVLYEPATPSWLRQVPSVEVLRQTWLHNYVIDDDQLRLRQPSELPPSSIRFGSPYDPEAHYSTKNEQAWTGYKVHLTETCEKDEPHLITQVETTLATTQDIEMVAPIHQALANKELLPKEHIVDSGYISGEEIVQSQSQHQVELIGPLRSNSQWQAREKQGYDLSNFKIDWANNKVECPERKISRSWKVGIDGFEKAVIHVGFSRRDCSPCPSRSMCTKSTKEPRELSLRPQIQHETIQRLRQEQASEEWKILYKVRAGVEGTISQGVRAFGLRKCRYIGLAKTQLQHLATAAAINLVRAIAWLEGIPQSKTRTSRFAALALYFLVTI